jgi:hypothetical protein
MNDSLAAALELAKSNGKILAVVATVAVLLTRALTRKSPLVRDLNRVATTNGKQTTCDFEYDVIIIGGGKSL